MKIKKIVIISIVTLLCLLLIVFFVLKTFKNNQQPKPHTSAIVSPKVTQTTQKTTLSVPIKEFTERITKKPFGIYITPENSPISPERFRGYHTGADVEYADIEGEAPVYSIKDGEVVLSQTVSGYGGVTVIKIEFESKNYLALYGHLAPQSMLPVGTKVGNNEQIGILGKGGTAETDGERKHLHFAIIKGTEVDLRGYVSNQDALANWLNPLDWY